MNNTQKMMVKMMDKVLKSDMEKRLQIQYSGVEILKKWIDAADLSDVEKRFTALQPFITKLKSIYTEMLSIRHNIHKNNSDDYLFHLSNEFKKLMMEVNTLLNTYKPLTDAYFTFTKPLWEKALQIEQETKQKEIERLGEWEEVSVSFNYFNNNKKMTHSYRHRANGNSKLVFDDGTEQIITSGK